MAYCKKGAIMVDQAERPRLPDVSLVKRSPELFNISTSPLAIKYISLPASPERTIQSPGAYISGLRKLTMLLINPALPCANNGTLLTISPLINRDISYHCINIRDDELQIPKKKQREKKKREKRKENARARTVLK